MNNVNADTVTEWSANPALKGIVTDLLREAGERFIIPRFKNLSAQDITTKSSETDFVTIADKEAEARGGAHAGAQQAPQEHVNERLCMHSRSCPKAAGAIFAPWPHQTGREKHSKSM